MQFICSVKEAVAFVQDLHIKADEVAVYIPIDVYSLGLNETLTVEVLGVEPRQLRILAIQEELSASVRFAIQTFVEKELKECEHVDIFLLSNECYVSWHRSGPSENRTNR
jgi:hypothetical protein